MRLGIRNWKLGLAGVVGYAAVVVFESWQIRSFWSYDSLTSRTVVLCSADSFGSGVALDSTTILTAKHVAKNMLLQKDVSTVCPTDLDPNAYVLDTGGARHRIVRCRINPHADCAIVTVSPGLSVKPIQVSKHPLNYGDELVYVGAFSDPNFLPCIYHGRVVRPDVSIPGFWRHICLMDAHIYHGCSGGPVYYRGQLIAITVGSGCNVSSMLPVSRFAIFMREAQCSQ